MADVTRVRLTGKPRPLGVLKDEGMYFDIANKYKAFRRKERLPHDSYRRGWQLTQEMKGGLHQAALINIVAAVNDRYRYSGEPVRKPEHLHVPHVDHMTVLSTLVSQRDRTISIPRPQMYTNFPHKLIQRKPVYYKHSEEEVKRDNAFLFNRSATSFQLKSRAREKPSSSSSEPLIKISSVISSKDGVQGEKTAIVRDPFTDSTTSKSQISRRKHGTQSRHSESRKYREISKCDAIDIMDATDAMKREHTMSPKTSHSVNSDSDKKYPNPFPFYRTKSLPAIFSPRRNKSGSAKPRQRTPTSSSGQQQLLSPRQIVQTGSEIPQGVYGRPVITSRGADNNEDIRRPTSRSSRDVHGTSSPSSLSSLVDSDNRPTTSPVLERLQLVGIASRSSKSDDRARVNDLQRRISTENGAETMSDVSVIESRFIVSAKSQKSIIVNRQQGSTEGASEKRASFKRVKFASVDDVDIRSDDQLDTTSVDNTHKEILAQQYHVQGHQYSIGSNDIRSDNNYYQSSSNEPRPDSDGPQLQSRELDALTLYNHGSLKPMTLSELDRLKQKFIPNDLRSSLSSQQSFYLYDDIKISKLKTKEINAKKKESDITTKEEEEVKEKDTKTDSESKLPETNEVNETKKEINDLRKEQEEKGEKRKENETNEYSGEDEDSKNPAFVEKQTDKKEESVYKLMRAFENDPYSDYEHKKIRKKHQNSYYDKSENKHQYLKVKLDN